jgi:hypothetical protein
VTYSKRRFAKEACFGSNTAAGRQYRHGGTVINIIFALIFFGLLAFGILWLIKGFGEVGQQYTDTMVQTKYNAITVKCQTNLRAIGQNIQIYAVSNEGFPPSQEELMKFSGNTQLFRCPAPDGEKYIYIPGQNGGMPPENILVYEPKAVHDGRCSVLRLGGQLELLTPEELQQALEQTRANIR